MKIICGDCKKDMGEKEGPNDLISHSICSECVKKAREEIRAYREKNK